MADVAGPRIQPVMAPGHEERELLDKTLATPDGAPLNIFATLAHHPHLLKRFNALGGLFLAHGNLPPRDRELVILRVAWRTRSVYEFGQHTLIGRRCSLGDAEIAAVTRPPAEGEWAEEDRALLEFVDELIDTDAAGDDAWRAMAARWTQRQLLELVMLVGFYRMVAVFLNTVRVQPESDLPGWPG